MVKREGKESKEDERKMNEEGERNEDDKKVLGTGKQRRTRRKEEGEECK